MYCDSAVHNVSSVTLGQRKRLVTEGGTEFWSQTVDVITEDGGTFRVTLFADAPERLDVQGAP